MSLLLQVSGFSVLPLWEVTSTSPRLFQWRRDHNLIGFFRCVVAADTLDIRVTSYYTSLTLTWSKPPGKKIQSYNISYGLASQSTIIGYAKRVRGNETHHFVSLDSLTANMTYRITVRWQTNMTLLTAQTLPCSLGNYSNIQEMGQVDRQTETDCFIFIISLV